MIFSTLVLFFLIDLLLSKSYPIIYTGLVSGGKVNSMDVRIEAWKRIKLDPNVPLLVDPRMGAEVGRIFCVRPTDITAGAMYEENLYPSSEAEQLPCSARSIIYCPTVMAGLIAAQVKAYAMGLPVKREIFIDLPNLLLGVA